jgi:hypothetical protein
VRDEGADSADATNTAPDSATTNENEITIYGCSTRPWWQPGRLDSYREKIFMETEPGRRIVVRPNKTSHRLQARLIRNPLRPRPPGYLTLNKGQYLATSGINTQKQRCAVKPNALQMPKQLTNQRRMIANRPTNSRTTPHKPLGNVATFERDLNLVRIVNPFPHGHPL